MDKAKFNKQFKDDKTKRFWYQIEIEYQGNYSIYNTFFNNVLNIGFVNENVSEDQIIETFLDLHCELYGQNYLLYEKDKSHTSKNHFTHYSTDEFDSNYLQLKPGQLMVEVWEIVKGGHKVGDSIFVLIKYQEVK